MAVLGEQDGLGAGAIGERTAMDKVAVSRAVADLIEKGLLHRVASQADGRVSHLHLSAEGRAVYDRIAQIALDYERSFSAGCPIGSGQRCIAPSTLWRAPRAPKTRCGDKLASSVGRAH